MADDLNTDLELFNPLHGLVGSGDVPQSHLRQGVLLVAEPVVKLDLFLRELLPVREDLLEHGPPLLRPLTDVCPALPEIGELLL